MRKIEFFFAAEGSEIIAHRGNSYMLLSDDDSLVEFLRKDIKRKFPTAWDAIIDVWKLSEFEAVIQFVKCNFSVMDNIPDIDGDTYNFEYVHCPMRGICANEGTVCNMKMDIGLSVRELEVAKLIVSGDTTEDIAHSLFISPNTVNTHRKNIYKKLGCNTLLQLNNILNTNNLLK